MINPILILLAISIGWGVLPTIMKLGMKDVPTIIPSFLIYTLIYMLLSIILIILYNKSIKENMKLVTYKNMCYTIFGSIIGALCGLGYFYLLKYINNKTTMVVLITHSLPIIITAFLSYFFLKEEITPIGIGSIFGILFFISIFSKYGTKKQ